MSDFYGFALTFVVLLYLAPFALAFWFVSDRYLKWLTASAREKQGVAWWDEKDDSGESK